MQPEACVHVCAPSIVWTRSGEQIYLVDSARAASWTLRGRETIIWELLTLGYDLRRLSALLSELWAVPAGQANAILLEALRAWRDAGILVEGQS